MFILLFEVVLGSVYDNYDHLNKDGKIPSKFQSFKAFGNKTPDSSKSVFFTNGVEVPVGKLIDAKKAKTQSYLNLDYNEYIVYNENQARLRYILQLSSS